MKTKKQQAAEPTATLADAFAAGFPTKRKTLTLNGYKIPVEHYARVKRLFREAFLMTYLDVPLRVATKAAMEAALSAQAAMFKELRFYKAGCKR